MISVVLERYKKIRNFNHLQFKTTFKMAYLHCITLLVVIVSVSANTVGTCLSTYHFDSIIRELTIKINSIMSHCNNEYKSSQLLHSCEEIKKKCPDYFLDYYMLVDSHGHVHQAYCHMETLCNSTGGCLIH